MEEVRTRNPHPWSELGLSRESTNNVLTFFGDLVVLP
jgi:hypothetical protein